MKNSLNVLRSVDLQQRLSEIVRDCQRSFGISNGASLIVCIYTKTTHQYHSDSNLARALTKEMPAAQKNRMKQKTAQKNDMKHPKPWISAGMACLGRKWCYNCNLKR